MAKNIEVLPRRFRRFQMAIRKESERGQVLLATGLFEEHLKEMLLAQLVKGKQTDELVDGSNAPLGTFSARINACYALGLISEDECYNLTIIRRIRNEFAHNIETTFNSLSVVSRCAQLRTRYKGNAKYVFLNAVWRLLIDLMQRPRHISKKRLKIQKWPEFSAQYLAED